ncbi:MAG TPA: DNA polymerase Y family protein [Stellaceae bacterium]|nr:DNA polymerase Y family protein [Stellaceae bacterium]
MHRVLYVFLPDWPIDRLRRNGLLPAAELGRQPDDKAAPFSSEECPFATVVAANGKQLLAAVNPAAAAKGLAAGLPLADALSFLPGLATRPAEPAEDAAALLRLAEWCGRYSPWTAPDGTDGVKIEVTGSAHLWGGEAALAADLSRRLARQGIAHRLAVADTLGAAWAVARGKTAAKAAAAEIVMSGKIREAIAPLPVTALRLDPALVQGLYRVGLRRIGEVLAMPRAALARRFGEAVVRRLDQALGDEPEPLSPLGEVPSRRVRLSFAEPIAEPADLARAIERLTGDLVTRLAREGMGARRLALGLHRVDGRVEHIRIGTARPSRDPAHLARLMIGKLDTVDPGLGVEDAILAAFAVDPLAPEQLENPALRKADPHPPAEEGARRHRQSREGSGWELGLAPLFDRLGARLGLDALARLEARESHIPERASMAVLVADSLCPDPPPPAQATPPQKPPRPIRLFAPPEPVEAVIWMVPDDPPSRFTWRRRTHRIARADGPERIAEEWWHHDGRLVDGAGDPGAVRDYYRVEDETGRRFWLFRAGLPGDPPPRWFIHGVFA